MVEKLFLLVVLPILVLTGVVAVKHNYLGRSFWHCDVWLDLWSFLAMLNIGCIAESDVVVHLGFANAILSWAHGGATTLTTLLLAWSVAILLLFGLSLPLAKAIESARQNPGAAAAAAYSISHWLRLSYVHAAPCAAFTVEMIFLLL